MTGQKSVVLITVDCLRADHCGFMSYSRPTTPFLDSLAKESFVFPTAIAGGVPTYYSLPVIMASRYPLALGREVVGLAAEEKSLTSIFKENRYSTAFFGAGNPYLSAHFGYDFGFDTFCDFVDEPLPLSASSDTAREPDLAGSLNRILAKASHKVPGIAGAYDELYFQYCHSRASSARSLDALRRFPSADTIVDRAADWLGSSATSPFFLWLHFMDPHSPYYPTEKGLELFDRKELTASRARYLNAYWNRSDIGSGRLRRHRDEIVRMYDSGIRWVDFQISRLVAAMRQSKVWENCIFALTADHGEEFLEHDRRYHAPSLNEELIHVPLLLRVPGVEGNEVPANPFSLLNLAPTMLAAAGLAIPTDFKGKNYWKNIQEGSSWDEPAISECIAGCTNPFNAQQRRGARLLAVREARYKLVLNFDTQAGHLFDLEADPGEKAPLSSALAKPERSRLLQGALEHLRKACTRIPSEAYLRTRLRDIDLNTSHAITVAGSSAAD